jgi:hypothetical protein
MNNLTLSLSGAELSRLRALVAEVETEIALASRSTAPAGGLVQKTALNTTWTRLVSMLDLGSEPEMRKCPACNGLCTLGATRCVHCWGHLRPLKAKEKPET